MTERLKLLADGLGFVEAPRWHEGELWFSDFLSRRVHSVNKSGACRNRAYVAGQPSGIGFELDGSVLVVSMYDRKILRLSEDGRLSSVACSLSAFSGRLNDMYVDHSGRAYLSVFDADPVMEEMHPDSSETSTPLLMMDGATIRRVAEDLAKPNGITALLDGSVLIVAETLGHRLTAFDVAMDGTLSGKRVFADLGDRAPDGICADSEDAIWVGCVFAEEFVRVREGGEVLEVIAAPGRWAVAPALGGEDRRTLYCATARTTLDQFHHGRSMGAIEMTRVDVPGPGYG